VIVVEGSGVAVSSCNVGALLLFAHGPVFDFFSLIQRSHSISFTRAQGIPKYKIGFGRIPVSGWVTCGCL
jgi:hypothetical protein